MNFFKVVKLLAKFARIYVFLKVHSFLQHFLPVVFSLGPYLRGCIPSVARSNLKQNILNIHYRGDRGKMDPLENDGNEY